MKRQIPELLISDKKGRIYSVPGIEAAGMKGGLFFRLRGKDLIKLPHGSELFILPQRSAVGYNPGTDSFIRLDKNPLKRGGECFAVSAFVSPGYTITHNSAYINKCNAAALPLFSYAAVSRYKNEFYAAAFRVDRELRQDLRFMDLAALKRNVRIIKRQFPANRLVRHLETCALIYGCPAAKNFFLKRYEAPLPTSPACNARCAGCISYQPGKSVPVTQPRIRFTPTPKEVADIACFHIANARDPVVSFGQGCEGEPLLAARVLIDSVRLIREKTKKGMINLNTNASRPDIIAGLFDSGLDSIRVSLNSAQELYYKRYYRPAGYGFRDVMKSIEAAKKRKGFVSVNYLISPGFTDSYEEFKALKRFLKTYNIDMVQLRNLNIDPLKYFKTLKFDARRDSLLSVREVALSLREKFPRLMLGYFNPSRQRVKRHHNKLST